MKRGRRRNKKIERWRRKEVKENKVKWNRENKGGKKY